MLKLLIGLVLYSSLSHAAIGSLVYTPPNLNRARARVVVAIHGCQQSSELMAAGSGWNQMAEKHNLVIIYPQLLPGSHFMDCWSYWDPANLTPHSGQLRDIHDEMKKQMHVLGIPNAPVLVTGISSGAATAAGLLACFPNDFTAGAIHSGVAYGLVTDQMEALKVQTFGPRGYQRLSGLCNPQDFKGRLMVLHGTADTVVAPSNAEKIIEEVIGFVPKSSQSTKRRKDNGLKYEVTDYSPNNQLRARLVMINKLPHSWSGFQQDLRFPKIVGPKGFIPKLIHLLNPRLPMKTDVPFFYPKGPSSTRMIYEWFDQAVSGDLLFSL